WLCLGSTLGIAPPAAAAPDAKPEAVRLAEDGQALQPIVTAENASATVKKTAQTLADYLGRISGARFEATTGDGQMGIAVRVAPQFRLLPYKELAEGKDLTKREDYLLHSHAKGLHVVGATDQAVAHAVWDLLYRLGHRQFFPGPTWEVVPRIKNLQIAVDARE